jgi:hypothetical protein
MLSSKCLQQIFTQGYHANKVNCVVKLQEYVGECLDAPNDVWDEPQPHTEASYGAYVRWYLTRTRPYVALSRIDDAEHQHPPAISDTYPLYRD